MKKKIILMVILALFILTILNARTKALIIGVGDYEEVNVGDLKTAVKDAGKFADTLIKLGIVEGENLKLLLNPRYTDMVYELVSLVEDTGEDDRIIFYYGGHSEQAKNEEGKTDVYLLPVDFREKVLTRTAVNFRREWQEVLSHKLMASETVMIFDTCYSGGITKERGLENFQVRDVSFEAIAEEKGVNFLFSSAATQTSLEKEEGQGGWFTYYLLEGLAKGAANLNGDETINVEELSKYVSERVSSSTKKEQTPVSIIGKKEMTIAEDENLLFEKLKTLIVTKFLTKAISEENSALYIKILEQSSLEDSPKETQIRNYLRKYYDDRDIISLEAVTEKIMRTVERVEPEEEEAEIQTQTIVIPETKPEPEEEKAETKKREGTNWLTILPGNEMANGATVYINGEKEGILTEEGLLIKDLEKGKHLIEIDGENINRDSVEIEFQSDWMMMKQSVEARTAKRKIMITTTPLMATVKLNGEEQEETTPLMIEIEVGTDNEIIITKDSYKEKMLTIREEEKGEPKELKIELEKNEAPLIPRMLNPIGTEEELETELRWLCEDPETDSLTYEIWLGEAGEQLKKITETTEERYGLKNLKSDTEYNWKIIAKDQWNQTEGTIWRFKTRKILTRNYRIESEPEGAKVYINNGYKGITPQTVTLKEGTHEIKIELENYKEQTKKINLNANTKNLTRMETINFTLEKAEKEPELTEMVKVEGGSFQMGSNDGDSDEKPVHEVTITYDYWIGTYEVTFDEYDRYCEEKGTTEESDRWGRGKQPVIYVSWNEAIKYCNWLSEKEDLAKAYDSNGNLLDKNGRMTTDIKEVEGYRLPTEAEWEYAARGGNKSKGYTYSGSNNIGEVAWYSTNSDETHEVGGKKANELGLYDMSGNVWEWCQDWYDSEYYGKSGSNDPVNLDSASYRVIRGGSWDRDASYCRVAYRDVINPDSSYDVVGFRVARTRFF